MSLRYPRIGVTVKSDLDAKDEVVAAVLTILCEQGAEVFMDPKRTSDLSCAKKYGLLSENTSIDLLVVIGGDGTILRAIREMRDFHVPILSVNRGAVGFLAEIGFAEAKELLPKLLKGQGVMEERSLLCIKATRGKKQIFEGKVLNEAVIAQGAIARLLELRATVDGEELTMFHADGLIIATPTGSTAYNLAAGGPIVHPRLSAMILTPLNAHSFSQKPIVLPGAQTVEVEVFKKANKFLDTEVSLTLDGQVYHALQGRDLVRAHINSETVKFLRRKQDTFYGTLRTKLKWGERLEG